jgi:hypothetical protein
MNPNYVQVVNSIWNGSRFVKRKRAAHLVSAGRACWVGECQLRLLTSHPKNMEAAARAAEGYHTPRSANFEELVNLPFTNPTHAFRELMTRRHR